MDRNLSQLWQCWLCSPHLQVDASDCGGGDEGSRPARSCSPAPRSQADRRRRQGGARSGAVGDADADRSGGFGDEHTADGVFDDEAAFDHNHENGGATGDAVERGGQAGFERAVNELDDIVEGVTGFVADDRAGIEGAEVGELGAGVSFNVDKFMSLLNGEDLRWRSSSVPALVLQFSLDRSGNGRR